VLKDKITVTKTLTNYGIQTIKGRLTWPAKNDENPKKKKVQSPKRTKASVGTFAEG